MMNNINEMKEHSEPEKYLEIKAENVLGSAGYVHDGAGKRIRPEGNDRAQSGGGWYRNE